jgi:hypothetical protein
MQAAGVWKALCAGGRQSLSFLTYLKPATYALTFAAGVLVMGLYHSAAVSAIEAKQANASAKQSTLVVEKTQQDTKDNDANVFQYLEQITAANQSADDLRKRLVDGSISLRVCRADTIAARVSAANSDAAKEQAVADFAAYREDVIELVKRGKELDAWVVAAFEFINRNEKSPR